MSARGRGIALSVAGALVVAALVAWWFHGMHRVTEWVDLPARGEATWNRLYPLQKALQASGRSAQSRRRLQMELTPLGERDTVVMLQDTLGLQADETYDLLDWVEDGGHLVVALPQGDADLNRDGSEPTLTEILGVQRRKRGDDDPVGDCLRFTVSGATKAEKMFCYDQRFDLSQGAPVFGLRDPAGGWVMARIAHGKGSVDVLSSMQPIQRNAVESPVSAWLTAQLLAPNDGHGTFHLIYEPGLPSMWLVIGRKGWMAWAPALLALLAWLWWRTQRVGPLLPGHVRQRRSLIEHVTASGELLWRFRRGDLLYQAVRTRFIAKLRRRDPVAAAQPDALQAEMIAATTGVPAATIQRALQAPPPGDAHALRERIALLIDLGKQL